MDRKQFGNLKRLMMKRLLTPHGYRKGKQGLFYRVLPHGIVGIDLQTSEFRDAFFVNVAWTFAGLPGFSASEPVPPERLELLDFAFFTRLRLVAKQADVPEIWLFMNGESEVELSLQQAMAIAIDVGDSIATYFADTRTLLEELPPDLVLKDYRDLLDRDAAEARTVNPEWFRISSALHGFYPDTFNLACSLFHLARLNTQPKLADEYLAIAKAAAQWDHDKAIVQQLATRMT